MIGTSYIKSTLNSLESNFDMYYLGSIPLK